MQNYRPLDGIPPAVKALLILNVVMFLLSMLIEKFGIDVNHVLGLHLPQSHFWWPWQYVTHMFMHGSISHLFFNMFALFMFGRILESTWGSRRFVIYYFVCGIGAGLLNSAIGWFEIRSLLEQYTIFQIAPDPNLLAEVLKEQIPNPPSSIWTNIDNWINNPSSPAYIQQGKLLFQEIIDLKVNIPMVGASGAVFGLLLAFGMLFPNTELYLMFIPIPIKAKYFVLGYGLIEVYLGLQNNPSDNIAHFAHLGGMLFGFILLKYWSQNRRKFY